MSGDPMLRLVDVVKTYPNGVRAVRGVSLDVDHGEIHAVIGENGAGKSTLMKMAYGLETLTSGHLVVDGDSAPIQSPADAIARGIGLVHQNLLLVPSFTMAENIVLGTEPGPWGWVDRRQAVERVAALSRLAGLPIEPDMPAAAASVGVRQRAAILKALGRGARLLILDEPTAVLTPQETDELFAAIERLRDGGLTVVLISHKLNEVRAISDRISVMRRGALIATHATEDTTEEGLAFEMVGRTVSLAVRPPVAEATTPALRIDDVVVGRSDRPAVGPVSLEVRRGEILGIAGIDDNGQPELMKAIAGQLPVTGGRIVLGDVDVTGQSVRERRAAGLSSISEDRLDDGSASELSILDNLIVTQFDRPPVGGRIRLRPSRAAGVAETLMKRFDIKAPDARLPMQSLSGGNMQKVIIARELSSAPAVLLASQPTRGVDIGAKEFIYGRLADARDAGTGVLLVSADLTEVLNLSDRLLVMRDGKVVASFDDVAGLTEQDVGRLMLGVEPPTSTEPEHGAADDRGMSGAAAAKPHSELVRS